MALLIPEVKLFVLIRNILLLIRSDYEANKATPDDSILAVLFKDNKAGKYDFYEQSINLFITKEDNPRNVEARYFFDPSRAGLPTMHITCPSDPDGGQNSIGNIHGEEVQINTKQGVWKQINTRYTQPTYQIIMSSDNTFEVLTMYNTFKALLIGLFAHLEIDGLQNPHISGGDLYFNEGILPPNVYARGLNLQVEYATSIPDIFGYHLAKGTKFNGQILQEYLVKG
jgi:hypothetical protein